jgi:acylphosphatase
MEQRLEATIEGRVQLVMFRDFTCRKARALNLVGTVENCADGSVRVIAEGEKEALQQLLEALKRGPLLAQVDHVEAVWSQPTGEFSGFTIIYD